MPELRLIQDQDDDDDDDDDDDEEEAVKMKRKANKPVHIWHTYIISRNYTEGTHGKPCETW